MDTRINSGCRLSDEEIEARCLRLLTSSGGPVTQEEIDTLLAVEENLFTQQYRLFATIKALCDELDDQEGVIVELQARLTGEP